MIVTTSDKPNAGQIERAHRVAERCDVLYVPRRGPIGGFAYVVGRNRDELRDRGTSLTVHQGMLRARLQAGLEHPLIRALGPAKHVVDGTLGLAGDALHIASVLECQVTGIEGSPVIFSLLEEGIPRLARELDAAGRISLRHGEAGVVLDEMGPADAVFLAPMYQTPRAASPGFELLRQVALHDPLSDRILDAAARIAPRIVVKVDPGTADVAGTIERIRGKSVDYLVIRGSADTVGIAK